MKELEAMKRYDSFDFMYFHEVIRIVDKQYLGDAEELIKKKCMIVIKVKEIGEVLGDWSSVQLLRA